MERVFYKSSYTNTTGECVEISPPVLLPNVDDYLEVGDKSHLVVYMRDSKDTSLPYVRATREAFAAFVEYAGSIAVDRDVAVT